MDRRFGIPLAITVFGLWLWPSIAQAGMPAPWALTEHAVNRLSAISFFLAIFFVAAGFIRLIWNSLRQSFPRLPVLSYRRALALVFLWGLLFVVVLLMVSAARELMTPGAWERDGTLYRVTPKGSQK